MTPNLHCIWCCSVILAIEFVLLCMQIVILGLYKRARKGAIHKTKAPKKVNHAKAVQVVLLLVQITSRSPNFLANVSFARKQDIKLQIAGRELACSICLGCLAQPKQNKYPLQFPLGQTKQQKEVYWSSGLGFWEFGWCCHRSSCCISYATANLR